MAAPGRGLTYGSHLPFMAVSCTVTMLSAPMTRPSRTFTSKTEAKMSKLTVNHKPSIAIHGLFGYVWLSVELFLGTARLANSESRK